MEPDSPVFKAVAVIETGKIVNDDVHQRSGGTLGFLNTFKKATIEALNTVSAAKR